MDPLLFRGEWSPRWADPPKKKVIVSKGAVTVVRQESICIFYKRVAM